MIHVQCKRQNGVVKEFLAYFNSRQPHALRSGRLPQRGRGPAGSPRPARRSPERKRRGGRVARAPPGPAGRGKGDWRRRGALPGTARAGPPPRERGPRSGAGARGCWPKAAGGARPRSGDRPEAGKVPAGQPTSRAPSRGGWRECSCSPQGDDSESSLFALRTPVRESTSSETRTSSSVGDGGLRREPTEDRGWRAGSASERGRAVAGGRGATCAPPSALRARAGASRGPAHARTLSVQPRLLKSASTP